MCKDIPWKTLSEAYAFVGNSLLKPMTMTLTVGLDPAFWEAFPAFDGPQRASVEYTRLFVGPPSPAAAPWETMYRGKDVTVGFGQATFEMRELLREAGLEVRNANNQYEDHMGIELLYLSELCRREATGEGATESADIAAFIEQHPLAWIEPFLDRVSEAAPNGYFAGLLLVAQRVLEHHARLLAR